MSAPTPGFGLAQIGQIALPISDTDRAVTFYRDALGMRLLFQFGNLAFFDCAGVRLMLSPPEGMELGAGNSVVYYKVPDIQAACEILTSRGVTFEDKPHLIAKMPDHDLWMTFFRDPDRNLLALMSEVSHS
jgi:methylmalonyl-CoA/ethylmalonyl-CoA epimerase